MGLADGLKIGAFVVDRINQVSNWIKGKRRKDDVQTMDKAIDSDNSATVNAKLDKLRDSVKDKQDRRS